MRVIQAATNKGSLTNCIYVLDEDGTIHCMSYGQEVARITNNGEYIEYNGDMFYSRTSVRHKNAFKKYFNI